MNSDSTATPSSEARSPARDHNIVQPLSLDGGCAAHGFGRDRAANATPWPGDARVADLWNRWLEQPEADQAPSIPLPDHLWAVVACSDYAAGILERDLDWWREHYATDGCLAPELSDNAAFRRRYGVDDPPQSDSEFLRWLRMLRHRELVRIIGRDVGGASLDEVLRDTSRLARTCIGCALERAVATLTARFGTPRDAVGTPLELVVLGLGKLGGGELNLSSDIDLIFAFPDAGVCDGPRETPASEFFRRVGQQMIAALADQTADGFCYRVDMRLRPFGDAGPLVMTFGQMEDYYQTHGREWERYALIKAGVVAGPPQLGSDLLRRLRPFIYRRYLDYGAFANLRDLKAAINDESTRKARFEDVKYGEGGIREVEFVAQAFQLIRGGRDAALQRPDLAGVLSVLDDRGLLPAFAIAQIRDAYVFLRRLENRLQMLHDQQTHRLPREPGDRRRVALAMGFATEDAFETELIRQQRRVHAHFEQVFSAPQRDEEGKAEQGDPEGEQHRLLARFWSGSLDADRGYELLAALGYARPDFIRTEVSSLLETPAIRALTSVGRTRLDRLMPLLVGAAAEAERPDDVLPRLLTLVRTIARRSVYLSLLVEHPLALSQLVRLCAASPWIAEQLTRHPVLLDELLDPQSLYAPPDADGLREALAFELEQLTSGDLEQLLDRLRVFKQVQTLRIAAADIMGHLPLMRVSDHLTWLAEVLLETVLRLAWESVSERYGAPEDASGTGAGFAIVGYGKLGGFELGYGSDLDLVFLHDDRQGEARTVGPKVIDVVEFHARVAQRMVHWMGTYTPAGRLYEIDTRLRPSGAAGLLVSPLAAFERYQQETAWTWEHQALVRARVVAGDSSLREGFAALRRSILARRRDPETLCVDVREMRAKMLAEHGSRDADGFDLKRDRGGITDIEFMVQYWVLAHAPNVPDVMDFPDKIRVLERVGAAGLVSPEAAESLADAYRALRNRLHRETLAGRSGQVPLDDDLMRVRETVLGQWQALFG